MSSRLLRISCHLAPRRFGEPEFAAVDTTDEEAITQRFNPRIRELHSYLNGLPCLRDIQAARRRWKARTAETEAFGNFAAEDQHWYTFHHGGRNEAQFNIGLCPSYLRIGLGFEFALREHGDPTAVQLAYACFRNITQASRDEFGRFVADNQLEIEWADDQFSSVELVATRQVVDWLFNRRNPPRAPGWIFIGRLLRRGQDTAILEDPVALGSVMQAVFCGFRPFWEQTQTMACACP